MVIKKPPDRPAFFNLSLVAKALFIGRGRDISMRWGLTQTKAPPKLLTSQNLFYANVPFAYYIML